MELNHEYDYPEELAILDTLSDVRISGMARFRYLNASDVQFSLRNIQEILDVKENFTKDVNEWKEIELYQSRNLFDMCIFVYDKLFRNSHQWREYTPSCTGGLTVKNIETLLELCLNPCFYKKLIKMKIKRLPFYMTPLDKPRRRQFIKFKVFYATIRRELREFKHLFQTWHKSNFRLQRPRLWDKMVRTTNIRNMLV